MFDRPEVTVANLDRLSRLLRSCDGEPCLLLSDEAVAMYASLPPEDSEVWSSIDDEDLEDLFGAVEFFVDSCDEAGMDEDFLADIVVNLVERLPVAN